MLTKTLAFEKQTMLAAIQSFDKNYSKDFQNIGFLENVKCTFSSVRTAEFASAMKNWFKNIILNLVLVILSL